MQAILSLSLPPMMDLVRLHILANENRATENMGAQVSPGSASGLHPIV